MWVHAQFRAAAALPSVRCGPPPRDSGAQWHGIWRTCRRQRLAAHARLGQPRRQPGLAHAPPSWFQRRGGCRGCSGCVGGGSSGPSCGACPSPIARASAAAATASAAARLGRAGNSRPRLWWCIVGAGCGSCSCRGPRWGREPRRPRHGSLGAPLHSGRPSCTWAWRCQAGFGRIHSGHAWSQRRRWARRCIRIGPGGPPCSPCRA